MKFGDHLTQIIAVEVGVDFRGGNGLVTQHFLYCPQIGSAFNQMRGKGMAKRVGADCLLQAYTGGQILNEEKHRNPRHLPATFAQEHNRLTPGLNRDMHPNLVNVDLDKFQRILSNRHQSFLVPLADHAHKADVGINVVQLKINEFGNPKTRSIQNFQHRAVALALGLRKINGLQQLYHFRIIQRVGEFTPYFRALQQRGRVIGNQFLKREVLVKAFDT